MIVTLFIMDPNARKRDNSTVSQLLVFFGFQVTIPLQNRISEVTCGVTLAFCTATITGLPPMAALFESIATALN